MSDNIVNYTIKLKDEVTRALQGMSKEYAKLNEQTLKAKQAAKDIELQHLKNTLAVRQAAKEQSQAAREASNSYKNWWNNALKEKDRAIKESARAETKAARKAAKELREKNKLIEKQKRGWIDLKDAIISAFAIYKTFEFSKSAVELTAQLQTNENVIKFTSKNALDAQENLEFLRNTIDKYKAPLLETNEGFARFIGSIKGSALEGAKARKVFDAFTIAGTALHLPADKMKSIYYAVGEMASKGVVQSQELKLQLANALYGTSELAADAMGTTISNLFNMMKAGSVESTGFLLKLSDELVKKFGSNIPDAVKSTQSKLTDINNKILELKDAYGQLVAKGLDYFYPYLIKIAKYMKNDVIPIIERLFRAIKWAIEILKPFKRLLLDLAIAASVYFTLNKLQLAIQGINIALRANPYLLAASAVAVLVSEYMRLKSAISDLGEFSAENESVKQVKIRMAEIKSHTKGNIDESALKNQAIDEVIKLTTDKTRWFRPRKPRVWWGGLSDEDKEFNANLEKNKQVLSYLQSIKGVGTADFFNDAANADTTPKDKQIGLSTNDTKAMVHETKPTIINITMDSLVHSFTIATNNLTESSSKIREEVLKSLLSVVNDSQLIAKPI
jgi:tape measure domain-containing protein